MKKMNKKGVTFKAMNWAFWRMLFLVVLIYTIYILTSALVNDIADTSSFRSTVFSNRISSSALSVRGEYTGRVYKGVISEDKFTEESILNENQIPANFDKFSAEIALTKQGSNTLKEYFNRQWFERYYPLEKYDQYMAHTRNRFVIVSEDNDFKPGRLLVRSVEKIEKRRQI
jgi:hypothetical protein